jgi:hypothetical protein
MHGSMHERRSCLLLGVHYTARFSLVHCRKQDSSTAGIPVLKQSLVSVCVSSVAYDASVRLWRCQYSDIFCIHEACEGLYKASTCTCVHIGIRLRLHAVLCSRYKHAAQEAHTAKRLHKQGEGVATLTTMVGYSIVYAYSMNAAQLASYAPSSHKVCARSLLCWYLLCVFN